MPLFYIEYGCSICTEHLIIEAKDEDAANEYTYLSAQEVYYSYDSNYPDMDECEGMDDDDIAEMMREDMENDIQYYVVPYNTNNEDHAEAMREQNNIPFRV